MRMTVKVSAGYAPSVLTQVFKKVFYCPNRLLCLFVVGFVLTKDGRYRKM